MSLYAPIDRETATRFFDEHVAPGKCPQWVETHRDSVIREHAVWCRFEREMRERLAQGAIIDGGRASNPRKAA